MDPVAERPTLVADNVGLAAHNLSKSYRQRPVVRDVIDHTLQYLGVPADVVADKPL